MYNNKFLNTILNFIDSMKHLTITKNMNYVWIFNVTYIRSK